MITHYTLNEFTKQNEKKHKTKIVRSCRGEVQAKKSTIYNQSSCQFSHLSMTSARNWNIAKQKDRKVMGRDMKREGDQKLLTSQIVKQKQKDRKGIGIDMKRDGDQKLLIDFTTQIPLHGNKSDTREVPDLQNKPAASACLNK